MRIVLVVDSSESTGHIGILPRFAGAPVGKQKNTCSNLNTS
jgi:hypothetical protein